MQEKVNSPLWLIGTHRSGTTMLSHILEKMNCYLGYRKNRHNESTYFQKANDHLLNYAGGKWDNPSAYRWLLEHKGLCAILACKEDEKLNSWRGVEFWGFKRTVNIIDTFSYWGWKDPRMSITAPIWLKLFPKPTIVRVVRNGVDVAASLNKRENYFYHENKTKSSISMRCLSLEGAFLLWEEYVRAEESWLLKNSHLPVFNCRYEDLLQDPETVLTNLCSFLGLEYDSNLSEGIASSRRYAFFDEPNLCAFYESIKDNSMMEKYGYSELNKEMKGMNE